MDRPVGDAVSKIEGGCTRDVCRHEGRACTIARWDLAGGSIDETDERAGDVDRDVFRAEEPRVIAAVPDKEFVLDSCVGVGEGTTLWQEDGSNAFVWGDNVESCEQVVVCQSNDALCCGERFPEAGIECGGIVTACLVESDEGGRVGNPSGC